MSTNRGRKPSKSSTPIVKRTGPVAVNRRASYDYDILETVEAGLVLTGTEIKSIRTGRVDLRGAYAREQKHELWLEGMHLAPYEQGNVNNHEPRRPRKLLLHRRQVDELSGGGLAERDTPSSRCGCTSRGALPRCCWDSPRASGATARRTRSSNASSTARQSAT